MTSTVLYQIIAGPSREELFDALRLRHEGREVIFTVVAPKTQAPRAARFKSGNLSSKVKPDNLSLKVQVNELGVEDGSGNRWLFKLSDSNSVLGSRRLVGYIDVTQRKGWIEPVMS